MGPEGFMKEEMTFLKARLQSRQIEEAGKALYLRSPQGTLNQIILPQVADYSRPFQWVYLLRADGQTVHIRLGNEQVVCIM